MPLVNTAAWQVVPGSAQWKGTLAFSCCGKARSSGGARATAGVAEIFLRTTLRRRFVCISLSCRGEGYLPRISFAVRRNKRFYSRITMQKKKKKKLHHSSHIRLIRWTLPVSRDIGEHNEQAESTSVKFWNHFSICACHPCAGAMLIFSVSFQFYQILSEDILLTLGEVNGETLSSSLNSTAVNARKVLV